MWGFQIFRVVLGVGLCGLTLAADWGTALPKGRVELVTHSGRTLSREGTHVPGDVESPMDWGYLNAKFCDAAQLAIERPSLDRIAKVSTVIRHLEDSSDATELLRIVAP